MKQNTNLVLLLLLLALLGACYLGYTLYPKIHKAPELVADTVLITDTVVHYIPDTVPYYIVRRDTIIYRDTIPTIVDTAEILADYYAFHLYERTWQDSLIWATVRDGITENSIYDETFTYKILRPQTVINNSYTSYSRYITVGAGFPTKSIKHLNVNLEATYVTSKFYVGIGYDAELNCPVIRGGATVFHFK